MPRTCTVWPKGKAINSQDIILFIYKKATCDDKVDIGLLAEGLTREIASLELKL